MDIHCLCPISIHSLASDFPWKLSIKAPCNQEIGYCPVGLSGDLHLELSDPRMEIIGPNSSRSLCPI